MRGISVIFSNVGEHKWLMSDWWVIGVDWDIHKYCKSYIRKYFIIYGGSLGFIWMLRSSRDKEEILGTNWGLRGFLGFCWVTYGSKLELVTEHFVYICKASKAHGPLLLDRLSNKSDCKHTGKEREVVLRGH